MGHKSENMNGELVAIVRRLDIDGDGKIKYNEFIEAISPVKPDILPLHQEKEPSVHIEKELTE